MKLKTFMRTQTKPDENYYIGMKSNFFYIGTAKEFFKDRKVIESQSKRLKNMGHKQVIDSYKRLGDGYAVVIEGDLYGGFWMRHEYEEWRKEYGSCKTNDRGIWVNAQRLNAKK